MINRLALLLAGTPMTPKRRRKRDAILLPAARSRPRDSARPGRVEMEELPGESGGAGESKRTLCLRCNPTCKLFHHRVAAFGFFAFLLIIVSLLPLLVGRPYLPVAAQASQQATPAHLQVCKSLQSEFKIIMSALDGWQEGGAAVAAAAAAATAASAATTARPR